MDQYTMTAAKTEEGFLKLYEQFADSIFRHCYFRVSSREVAEDLAQESFMKVWNYLASGKKIESPKAFVFRIASNLVVDYYRKKKETSLDKLTEEGFAPAGDDADSILMQVAGTQALAAIEKLDPPYREALIMRYVDDLSIGEMAKILDESENTISVRLHRGIEKLKNLLHYEKPN